MSELTCHTRTRRVTDPVAVAALGLVAASLAAAMLQLHHAANLLSTLCLP